MNIVDSSCWLEYLTNSKLANNYAKVIEHPKQLIVPSITLYEVFKKALQEKGESTALQIVAHMKQGKVIDLNLEISILAANLSIEYSLPMADSIILATARKHGATLYTQDADFKGLDGVKYFKKN